MDPNRDAIVELERRVKRLERSVRDLQPKDDEPKADEKPEPKHDSRDRARK